MKARLLHVLEPSTGPIRVANTFGRDEKATEDFHDDQSCVIRIFIPRYCGYCL